MDRLAIGQQRRAVSDNSVATADTLYDRNHVAKSWTGLDGAAMNGIFVTLMRNDKDTERL